VCVVWARKSRGTPDTRERADGWGWTNVYGADAIILRGGQGSMDGRENINGQGGDIEIGKRGNEGRKTHCWSTNQLSKGGFRGELFTDEGRSSRLRRRSTSL